MIRIAEPYVGENEKEEVLKTLNSGRIIQGKKVEEFERRFASYVGTKYAIAVSSGTAALHLALLSLNIGKGDEVITTPFSFIASTSSIILSGATPVFVDIDPITFNINPSEIEKRITEKTKAILPVHLYGLPCNMGEIMRIARKHHLNVIEDACQAHGAKIGKKTVGSFGDIGCFSFYPTKNMFVGEGGMITTNSPKITKMLRLLRNHGSDRQYEHSIIGFNYRMTDISASIGLAQIKRVEVNNKKRIKNAEYLSKRIKSHNVLTPVVPKSYKHVFHQYTILLNTKTKNANKKLKSYLEQRDIEARIYYPIPIHRQKALIKIKKKIEKMKVSDEIVNNILSLPIHPQVTKKDLDVIAKAINEYYK